MRANSKSRVENIDIRVVWESENKSSEELSLGVIKMQGRGRGRGSPFSRGGPPSGDDPRAKDKALRSIFGKIVICCQISVGNGLCLFQLLMFHLIPLRSSLEQFSKKWGLLSV